MYVFIHALIYFHIYLLLHLFIRLFVCRINSNLARVARGCQRVTATLVTEVINTHVHKITSTFPLIPCTCCTSSSPSISAHSQHSLLVWTTIHIPEPSQTHCTHLCSFPTSDVPVSPPLQPFHISPARKQRTVTTSSAIRILSHHALLTSRHLLVISPCLLQ